MEKYIILHASSLDKLSSGINAAMDAGYVVLGTPFGGSVFTDWNQAMLYDERREQKHQPTELKSRTK